MVWWQYTLLVVTFCGTVYAGKFYSDRIYDHLISLLEKIDE